MFDQIVTHTWDAAARCDSAAFTFWSYAALVVLFALAMAVVVLVGPSWLREARTLFVEDRCNG